MFGGIAEVKSGENVERSSVLEGLLKYQQEKLNAVAPYGLGFKEGFADVLAKILDEKNKDAKNPVCLAYSVEKGEERRRIFIIKDVGERQINEADERIVVKEPLRVELNRGLIGDKEELGDDSSKEMDEVSFSRLLKRQAEF